MEIPEGSSLDHAGIDRRTYEQPNCGSRQPHGQHIHSPIGGLRLNCPGVLGSPASQDFTPGERAMIRSALAAMATHYARESKSRRWTGPKWARVRAWSRKMATSFTTLSEDGRLS